MYVCGRVGALCEFVCVFVCVGLCARENNLSVCMCLAVCVCVVCIGACVCVGLCVHVSVSIHERTNNYLYMYFVKYILYFTCTCMNAVDRML